MRAIDKTRLEKLLRRVIGRPESIPAPPAPAKAGRAAVLASVYAPYRCEPTTWGAPVVAPPPAYGRSPATRCPQEDGASRGRERSCDLEPRPVPAPRGLLT